MTLEDSSHRYSNLLLLHKTSDKSLIIVGKWKLKKDIPGDVKGFEINGFCYISEDNATNGIIAHELLHTSLFGDLKHVDDPVNLMYKYENKVNILRHRKIKLDGNNGEQPSQWETLRNLGNLFLPIRGE